MSGRVTYGTLKPLVRNGHLQTILGNFWTRPRTEDRFPLTRRLYRTEPDVQVACDEQFPGPDAVAHAVLVHGLEGSSQSGYIRSLSRDLLEANIAVHRFNMRSCGGTEHLAPTNYHAGQTSDLRAVIETIAAEAGRPVLLIGFSLGGNASLKLAGEGGAKGLAGVCAVSTPLDLAACADALNRPVNIIYQSRFLKALKDRIRRRHAQFPDRYDLGPLSRVRSIWEFDDAYTAKLFGFGTAANYFATQSSARFLSGIAIPALIVHAKNDPLIPYSVYEAAMPAIRANPNLVFQPFETGGHVGFLARSNPRFWLDPLITRWAQETGNKAVRPSVSVG